MSKSPVYGKQANTRLQHKKQTPQQTNKQTKKKPKKKQMKVKFKDLRVTAATTIAPFMLHLLQIQLHKTVGYMKFDVSITPESMSHLLCY